MPDHYKGDSAGFFDEIEYIAINDNTARMNALMTGQVDAINRIDFQTEALLRANPALRIQELTGNQHYIFPMLTQVAPFNDVNVRRALKYGINRQEMVDKILLGHGQGRQRFTRSAPQTSITTPRWNSWPMIRTSPSSTSRKLALIASTSICPHQMPRSKVRLTQHCFTRTLRPKAGSTSTWFRNRLMAIGPTSG